MHQPCFQFQRERLVVGMCILYSGGFFLSCPEVNGHSSLCPGWPVSQAVRPGRLPHPQVTCPPERMVSVPSICLPINFSKIQEIISEASEVSLELNSLVLREREDGWIQAQKRQQNTVSCEIAKEWGWGVECRMGMVLRLRRV